MREVHHVLREDGVYVADLVVDSPNCLGVCDEWSVMYKGSECRVLHVVESIENEYFVESLELICNNVHYRSNSRLYLPKQEVLEKIAREAGFKNVVFLRPFTLQRLSNPRGRVFAVLTKEVMLCRKPSPLS